MKKSRKLVLSRETLHSLELRGVAGGALTYGLCTEGTGTATTGQSNSVYGCTTAGTGYTTGYDTYQGCTTGGACSGDSCSCGGGCH